MLTRFRVLLLVTALAVAISALSVGTAFAAKGGKAGGTPIDPAISAAPNPVGTFSSYIVSGCGFDTSMGVTLTITHSAGSTEVWDTGVWANGCITAGLKSAEAGTYTIQATQNLGKAGSLVGSTNLAVH